jgi:hypothetical protein
MTIATATEIRLDSYAARDAIETIMRDRAAQIWTEIVEYADENGYAVTHSMLKEQASRAAGSRRFTSRSTSVVSNMLEDLQESVIAAAYFALERGFDYFNEAIAEGVDDGERNKIIRAELNYARQNSMMQI